MSKNLSLIFKNYKTQEALPLAVPRSPAGSSPHSPLILPRRNITGTIPQKEGLQAQRARIASGPPTVRYETCVLSPVSQWVSIRLNAPCYTLLRVDDSRLLALRAFGHCAILIKGAAFFAGPALVPNSQNVFRFSSAFGFFSLEDIWSASRQRGILASFSRWISHLIGLIAILEPETTQGTSEP